MLTKGDDPSGLTPKSWKGWAYILISTIIIGCVSLALHKVDAPEKYQWSISIGLLVLFLLDIIDITRKIKKDERETLHEAFAERNVAWFMSATLSIGVLYQTFKYFQRILCRGSIYHCGYFWGHFNKRVNELVLI